MVNEVKSINAKIAQINDQIKKCKITNPIQVTVLNQYGETSEIVSFGKPLYKIGHLDPMTLRVYVSAIKIGHEVTVKIDVGENLTNFQDA